MRHLKGTSLTRRLGLIAVLAAMLAAVAMPAVASAYTRPSCYLAYGTATYRTYLTLPSAKTFTISGKTSSSRSGKTITVEIRKPGRAWYTRVGTATIDRYGRWSLKYYPKLGGKFFVRARYTATSPDQFSLSRTLYVKTGPGVKYQILLASTTSTQDSGLFEVLKPMFLAACPEYALKATFIGSGAAIVLGGKGDADVLLTHSPAAEIDFMRGIVAGQASAYKGLTRYKVMYNRFILVGPKSNPAGILDSDSARDAFDKIASTGSTFWSRNDNSGTNAKEKEIWALLGNPQTGKSWYKASGTMSMETAITAASDGGGYTLADNGTWLKVRTNKNLMEVNQGDSRYFNQYSVIEVARARDWEGAQDFRRWIMSPSAQALIRDYGVETFGKSLFTPNAGTY